MATESNILTTSGFERASPAKEEVARRVQRLWPSPAGIDIIIAVGSPTESFVVTESEDTLDEPWARWISVASDPQLSGAALPHQDQSLRDLRRFWDSVTEHTQGQSSPNVTLSTLAQTGSRPKVIDRTPEQQDPPIWEVVAEFAGQVSDEDWAKVPRDLAGNFDHYLYGTPKKKEDA